MVLDNRKAMRTVADTRIWTLTKLAKNGYGAGILHNNLPSYTPNIFTKTHLDQKIKKSGGLTNSLKNIYIIFN